MIARFCRAWRVRGLRREVEAAQRLGMTNFTERPSILPNHLVPSTDQLRLAVVVHDVDPPAGREPDQLRAHQDLDLEEQADPTHAARPAIIGALGTAAALHIHG